MKYQCSCGAIYELTEVHISQRDKDSIECEFCNNEIIHWNGSNIWLVELVKKPCEKD
jgi:hypothetical protein